MRRKFLKLTLYALVLAGILYACRQDVDEPMIDRPMSVDDARAWYQAHVVEYLVLESGKTGNDDHVFRQYGRGPSEFRPKPGYL